MSRKARRNHSLTFKARVAVDAIRGERTLAKLAKLYDVHANQIVDWKNQLLTRARRPVYSGRTRPRRRRWPFRVPSAFLTVNDPGVVQATLAPVFADTPLIGYRRDTLLEGLSHFPEYADADAHRALDAFDQRLQACKYQTGFFMPRDSLVVVDNHTCLHARTAFSDERRHLLRIRLRWENPSQQVERYRMVIRQDVAVG